MMNPDIYLPSLFLSQYRRFPGKFQVKSVTNLMVMYVRTVHPDVTQTKQEVGVDEAKGR